MVDTSNLLSTPEGYATPEQLKATYDYAKALLHGSGQQPVRHWSQGVSNMVNALVGGNRIFKNNQAENEANAVDAGRMLPMEPGGVLPPVMAPKEGSRAANASMDNAEPRGIRNKNPLNIEAGDFTKSQPGFVGSDGRFARFETTDQGINAANKLLDSYEKRGFNTVSKIVSRWAPPTDNNNTSAYVETVAKKLGIDPDAPIPPEMRPKLIAAMAEHENGRPVSTGQPNQPPVVSAMTAALRGEPAGSVQEAAAKVAVPGLSKQAMPSGSGLYIDPSLVRKPPQYNEGQMRGILASPRISEQVKMGLLAQYNAQGQPIEVPYPGGKVIIDPRDPTRQQFIPEAKWGKSKIGDIENDVMLTPDGRGGIVRAPRIMGGVSPRAEAPSAVAPVAAPGALPPVGGVVPPVVAENAPAAPVTPPVGPESIPGPAAIQTAALTAPAPAVSAPVAPAEGAASPIVPASEIEAKKNEPTPLTKLVQSGPPPGIDPIDWEAYQQKKEFDVNKAVDEDAKKKTIETGIKKYQTLSDQAAAARKQMPNLDYGLALLNDPNIYQGILQNEVTAWKRVKAAFPGFFGDEARFAAAPNEVFNKVVSGTILDNMKTALGGLGQVRVAEIDLLKQANASNTNTPASNRALLELSRRAVQKVDQLDDLAQQYVSGTEVVDPISGKTLLAANVDRNGEIAPRHGLDAGYDKLARRFTLDNPSLSAEDIANYKIIFDTGKDPRRPDAVVPAKAATAAPKGGWPTPPPGAINDLNTKPESRAQFEAIFGPADKYLKAAPPTSK